MALAVHVFRDRAGVEIRVKRKSKQENTGLNLGSSSTSCFIINIAQQKKKNSRALKFVSQFAEYEYVNVYLYHSGENG